MAQPTWRDSIHHDGSDRYVASRYPNPGQQVAVRLRVSPKAPVVAVYLRTCPDGEQRLTPMHLIRETPAACWWEGIMETTMPSNPYRFLILADGESRWLNAAGLQQGTPTDANDFRLLAGYQAPDWVLNSVFYQIFPDRFASGDPQLRVRPGEVNYRELSSTAPAWDSLPASGLGDLVAFYGGDLTGIRNRLDYLQDLGINALYLNPIFAASSNHRYDVTDYETVDPHLGGNQALVSLRQALSQRQMRFILDIVPNHCGFMHPWFQAALADPAAPSAGFFSFSRHPDDYACWLGVNWLPKLNYESARLRGIMYGDQDAVFRRWLQPPYAIDGWRIDVANMLARQGQSQLGDEVARGIRQAVKEARPDAYLLGESFFDGSGQLQGDMWDATMNYGGFAGPLWQWLAESEIRQPGRRETIHLPRLSSQALVETWTSFRAAIPWAIAGQQFNLVGSHDVPRLLNRLNGNLPLARLAAAILLAYPGVPCIYYGDEVGLAHQNPRQTMPWEPDRWDGETHAWYHDLIQLRRHSRALKQGGFQLLALEPDTIAYLRDTDDERVVVVAHRGSQTRPAGPIPVWHGAIADHTHFREFLGGRQCAVTDGQLPLPALPTGATIWTASETR